MATRLMIKLFACWPFLLIVGCVGLYQLWRAGVLEHDVSVPVFLSGFVSYLVGGIGALVERDAKSSGQSDGR